MTDNNTTGYDPNQLGSPDEVVTEMLDDTTLPQASSQILKAAMEEAPLQRDKSILFFISNDSQPIVFVGKDLIRLGRSVGIEGEATLDLSKYHASVFGVSRHHADIVYKDGSYYVKDNGSTNGTWLNNKKIPAYRLTRLHNADQLRLGHFMLVVRFRF